MSALTFLGLAKKAGRVESGDETVAIAARAGKAKLVVVASDCGRSAAVRAENAASDCGRSAAVRAENAASAAKCPLVRVPWSKDELGAALGRDTVSVAAVTDIGFASAFMNKLSSEAEGFEETAAGLRELAGRAEQRKKEQRRHEQKKRRGIK